MAVPVPRGLTRPGDRRALAVVAVGWLTARALVALAWLGAGVAQERRAVQHGQGLLAWDGEWYRRIADVGYGRLPDEALRFFPGFAWLGRTGGVFAGGREDVALVVVANLAAAGAAFLLHRHVRATTGDPGLADRSVLLLSLAPAAFVLVLAYTEALFLVASIAAVDAGRSRRWGAAGLAAAAAALVRPMGVLLAVPLGIAAVRSVRAGARGRALVGPLWAAAAPALATALWFGVVAFRLGDPLDPVTIQGDFRGDTVDPVTRLVRALGDAVGAERFGDGVHAWFAVAFIALAVVAARRFPAEWSAYAGVLVAVALSADNLNSLERYGLVAFPLTVALAALTERRGRFAVALVGSAVAFTVLAGAAFAGRYVP